MFMPFAVILLIWAVFLVRKGGLKLYHAIVLALCGLFWAGTAFGTGLKSGFLALAHFALPFISGLGLS
jgi:hypothetical protein